MAILRCLELLMEIITTEEGKTFEYTREVPYLQSQQE
jgi:hypothetical protein